MEMGISGSLKNESILVTKPTSLVSSTVNALLNRLVVISGWSVYPKLDFSLKINIWIHNWSSKTICSIRYTQYVHSSFWTLREWLYKRWYTAKEVRRLRRRTSLCWGLKYNHFLRVQNEICTYWVYLMEHIFFELQLCIEILIFKEKSNFAYTDHPEITPSLNWQRSPKREAPRCLWRLAFSQKLTSAHFGPRLHFCKTNI